MLKALLKVPPQKNYRKNLISTSIFLLLLS